ncbi:hypothetical protein V6N12_017266 [Hibiscus sabdariffa]|uniref:Uncharacterized protein n=1 Tax=Hibiscus sabdariffa TaxID=183260 RepID=A0ABR2CF13_9ROSI
MFFQREKSERIVKGFSVVKKPNVTVFFNENAEESQFFFFTFDSYSPSIIITEPSPFPISNLPSLPKLPPSPPFEPHTTSIPITASQQNSHRAAPFVSTGTHSTFHHSPELHKSSLPARTPSSSNLPTINHHPSPHSSPTITLFSLTATITIELTPNH